VESLEDMRIQHERCAFISPEADADLKRSRLQSGDILFSIAGTLGRVAIVSDEDLPANTNQAVAIVRPKPAIEPKFMALALHHGTTSGQAIQGGRGVGLQNINLQQLSELALSIPPLNEQRRIVAKLESLRARSRRAREALDAVPPLLEKLRQSILAAAFRGDLTKDWRAKHPHVEPATELLKRIRIERRKKWEEAELAKMKAKGKAPADDRWKSKYKEPEPVDACGLPELPEGWCWASLDELTFLVGGITKGQKHRPGTILREVPYLRVANVQRGHLDLDDVRTIGATDEDVAELRLMSGDILLNEGGDRD
jgi:type I restriction enzyme S subunit